MSAITQTGLDLFIMRTPLNFHGLGTVLGFISAPHCCGCYLSPIKTSVAKAVKKYGGSIPEEELVRILTAALYDVLSSTEFERYVKELAGK